MGLGSGDIENEALNIWSHEARIRSRAVMRIEPLEVCKDWFTIDHDEHGPSSKSIISKLWFFVYSLVVSIWCFGLFLGVGRDEFRVQQPIYC